MERTLLIVILLTVTACAFSCSDDARETIEPEVPVLPPPRYMRCIFSYTGIILEGEYRSAGDPRDVRDTLPSQTVHFDDLEHNGYVLRGSSPGTYGSGGYHIRAEFDPATLSLLSVQYSYEQYRGPGPYWNHDFMEIKGEGYALPPDSSDTYQWSGSEIQDFFYTFFFRGSGGFIGSPGGLPAYSYSRSTEAEYYQARAVIMIEFR